MRQAPFGGKHESPFGGLNESPFGRLNESPFGRLNESPFGRPNESPFGRPNESPFGDLGLPVPYSELTLGRFIAGAAERHGARPALIGTHETLSYAGLHARCRALARAWLALGIQRGARIALLLANGPDFVTAWYACGMVGAVGVPLSTYATAVEIDESLARCGAQVLITQRALARRRFADDLAARHPGLARLRDGGRLEALPALRHLVIGGTEAVAGATLLDEAIELGAAIPDAELDRRMAAVGPDDEGVILFTSGSTGVPKAIRHAHRAPVIQAWRWAHLLDMRPNDRIWTAYPYFWSAGLALAMGAPLAAGAALSLQEVIEPGAALERIQRDTINMLIVPAHIDVELAAEQRLRARDLRALQRVRGGSQLLAATGRRADERDLGTGYGLSEMFTLATYIMCDATPVQRDDTHGRVLPGAELRIVDPVTGAELPRGETGEITVRGATLMLGFLGEQDKPAFDSGGFHRPGDAGSIDSDGFVHWDGRVHDMIRSRGANVAPVEIERALMDWGGLKLPRAVGLPHPVFGEAIVVCGVVSGVHLRDGGDSVGEAAVVAALRERLASYKLPHRVLFFAEDELHLTGTQKVRAGQLRRLAARRIVDEDADGPWSEHLRRSLAPDPV